MCRHSGNGAEECIEWQGARPRPRRCKGIFTKARAGGRERDIHGSLIRRPHRRAHVQPQRRRRSEELCRLFAQKGADRFARISYTPGRTGSPILEDALAFVDCETIDEHDAGDHLIVVGRVIELGYQAEGKPLLFYRGGYGRFES